jgi:hypothetical protein
VEDTDPLQVLLLKPCRFEVSMDLEKGQVLIDFDFHSNVSFLDTLEFISITAVKAAFDNLITLGDIKAVVIEIKRMKPLHAVVRRTLPNPPYASLSQMVLESKMTLSMREFLDDEDIAIAFVHEDLP